MRYGSINEIFGNNQALRQRLLEVIADIKDGETNVVPDGEGWSVGQIVEHVSIVNSGMAGICGKLIEKARSAGAREADGLAISDEFYANVRAMATRKAEAPERVLPTGDVSIDESTRRLSMATDAFNALRDAFESIDLSGPKFPHPYFGDLTAVEWFALSGLHERRHTDQIERVLAKIRQ